MSDTSRFARAALPQVDNMSEQQLQQLIQAATARLQQLREPPVVAVAAPLPTKKRERDEIPPAAAAAVGVGVTAHDAQESQRKRARGASPSRAAASSSEEGFPELSSMPEVLQGMVGEMLHASDLLSETRRVALRGQQLGWHKQLQYLCVTDLNQLRELTALPQRLQSIKHLSLCINDIKEDATLESLAALTAIQPFAARLETLEINASGSSERALELVWNCFYDDNDVGTAEYPALKSVMIDLTKVDTESDLAELSFFEELFAACPALMHLSLLSVPRDGGDFRNTKRWFREHRRRKDAGAKSDDDDDEEEEEDDDEEEEEDDDDEGNPEPLYTGFARLESLRIDWPGFIGESLRHGWTWPRLRFYHNVNLGADLVQFTSAQFPALEGLVTQELEIDAAYDYRIVGKPGDRALTGPLSRIIVDAKGGLSKLPAQNQTLRFLHIVEHEVYDSRMWLSVALAFPRLETLCSEIALDEVTNDLLPKGLTLWPSLTTLQMDAMDGDAVDDELKRLGVRTPRTQPNRTSSQEALKAFLMASNLSTWSSACTPLQETRKRGRRGST